MSFDDRFRRTPAVADVDFGKLQRQRRMNRESMCTKREAQTRK
jgi:hypothetical protein